MEIRAIFTYFVSSPHFLYTFSDKTRVKYYM